MSAAGQKQFASLETLRFVASFIVLAYHYTYYIQKRDLFKGYLAVDLFFVLSGFVIASGYRSRIGTISLYGQFMKKRVARLYPLHFLTLMIYVCIGFAAMRGLVRLDNGNKYNLHELLTNLTLTHAWGFGHLLSFNTVSWSISAEFAAYLLFPLTLWLMGRGMLSGIAVIASLYVAAAIFAVRVAHLPLPQLTWQLGVVRAIPAFALGVWTALYLPVITAKLPRNTTIPLFYLSMVVFIACTFFSLNDYIGMLAASTLVILGAVNDYLGKSNYVSNRMLSRHGELTYSVYMIHPIVASILITGVFTRVFSPSATVVYVAILVSTTVTLVLSALSLRYFEQPLQRWIVQLGKDNGRPELAVPSSGELTMSGKTELEASVHSL
jgi:peptidoglycan/LPS O-acetylase OafA/YrhL